MSGEDSTALQASGAHGNRDIRVLLAGSAAAAIAAVLAKGDGPTAVAWFLLGVVATWCLVPWVTGLAVRVGATVFPGGRSVHVRATPLMGGLAILAPLAAVVVLEGDQKLFGFGAGCLLVALVGVLDDLRGATPRIKILVQLAAGLLLFAAGYRLPTVHIPPMGSIATGAMELPLFLAWIVLVTNAVNLIDGLDGLGSSVGLLAILACVAVGQGGVEAVVLAGALVGFLRYNLPHARVFLGDAGSLLLGFAVAVLLIDTPAGMNLPFAVGVMALPLGDVLLSGARRWLRGKPVFTSDRGHVHHLLLNLWKRPRRVLAALVLVSAVHAALAVLFQSLVGLLLSSLVWAGFCAYLLHVARSRWTGILLHRRRFKRAHVVRDYARAALELAESRKEVREVLERVAADFDLVRLQLNGVDIRRPGPMIEAGAEESVDCKGTVARWVPDGRADNPVFDEERRSIVCELVRRAADRLGALKLEEEARRGGFAVVEHDSETVDLAAAAGPGRPQVHFVLTPSGVLDAIEPVVVETRRRGRLDLHIVNAAGRGDTPAWSALQPHTELPQLDGGLIAELTANGQGGALLGRRYSALLDRQQPDLVVVTGRCNDAVSIESVAKARGIPVANIDSRRPSSGESLSGEVTQILAASITDLRVTAQFTGMGAEQGEIEVIEDDPGPVSPRGSSDGAFPIVAALEGLAVARRNQ